MFGQYGPYELAEGTWDSRRAEVQQQFIDLIEDFAPDFGDCIAHAEVLGPPDIEARVGLTGGHIFQGETMPDQMWEHRLTPRTPIEGFYFCGAATHPAGSVIGLNGRNAADAVLADTSAQLSSPSGRALHAFSVEVVRRSPSPTGWRRRAARVSRHRPRARPGRPGRACLRRLGEHDRCRTAGGGTDRIAGWSSRWKVVNGTGNRSRSARQSSRSRTRPWVMSHSAQCARPTRARRKYESSPSTVPSASYTPIRRVTSEVIAPCSPTSEARVGAQGAGPVGWLWLVALVVLVVVPAEVFEVGVAGGSAARRRVRVWSISSRARRLQPWD